MYFNNFKQVWYDLAENKKFQLATNILQRVAFRKRLKNEGDFYIEYTAKDTDKPEIIADKIYGDSNFHWVVLLFNEYLNPLNQWVRSQQGMSDHFEKEYTGNVIFLDTSDFIYVTGDIVTIDRFDKQSERWTNIGLFNILETNKSLQKIVVDGDVDYQIGDYVTIAGYGGGREDANAKAGERRAAALPPGLGNDAIVVGKPGTITPDGDGIAGGINPETEELGQCYNVFRLEFTLTGNKNSAGELCGYSVQADHINGAVCDPWDPDDNEQSNVETTSIRKDNEACTFSFVLEVHVRGGACYCVGTTNFGPSGTHLSKINFKPCLPGGCEPGGHAEQIFDQLVEENNFVGGLASCCGIFEHRSMRALPPGAQPESNEHLWFGIPKEKIVDSIVKAYRGYNGRVNLGETEVMQSYGKGGFLKNLRNPDDSISEFSEYTQQILKIVDVPEKSLHHFEDADGNTLNPFSNTVGETFTGSINNPTPVPFTQTLLYLHTQPNQILDGEQIKVVSIEEHELNENEKKRNIKLLKPEFLDIAVKELEDLLGGE
jgi:hypothetical protein